MIESPMEENGGRYVVTRDADLAGTILADS
jgi:hypothetical protein